MSRIAATIDLNAPGQSYGHLMVSYSDNDHAYSVIPVPVAVLSGTPGPTVLLAAGTHGDEWEGQLIARQILEQVAPAKLTGRIIVLPSLNLPAVRAASRCSPIDEENLNRAFPGDRDGGPTKMLADYVEAHLLPLCDYAIDLHSGGSASEYRASAFLRIDEDSRRTGEKVAAAIALGLPHSIVVDARGEARTFSAAADRQDVVMMATELGGAGRVDLEVLRRAGLGVRRLLVHWGLLAADAQTEQPPTGATQFLHLAAGSGAVVCSHGLLEPRVGLGDEVNAGEVVGRVRPLEDLSAPAEDVRAPTSGIVITLRTPPLVRPGDFAANIGSPLEAHEVALIASEAPFRSPQGGSAESGVN
ncbi:MAG: succinylglutamate desuccinylase/aspartoacylase family protein [Streptosporangiaceae bacterium]|jgi:predicted deacylase